MRDFVRPAARIGFAATVLIILGGAAQAGPREARVAVGCEVRNGDWLAFEALGLVLVGGSEDGANVAATARGVAGLGGAGGAIGLATGLGGPCVEREPCALRESVFSSIVGVEARVERTYGPSTWRHATYAGPHLSFGGVFMKWSAGWMFDLDDRTNNHLQLGIGGGW
jgi:hypothetical protein